ncbi:hypothetical protein D3C72_847330 [compost metagenome]
MSVISHAPSPTPPAVADAPFPLRDRLFWRVFSRTFVFSFLYEDTTVEERHFGVDSDSSVLAIAAAGCGIAGLLASHPRRIDAVDGNASHLALTALKVAASQHLESHEDLYAMFGHGIHAEPERVIAQVAHAMPEWAQAHWRRHGGLFRKGLHRHALASRYSGAARRICGADDRWMRTRMLDRPVEARVEEITRLFKALMAPWPVRLAARSPLVLLAQGINYRQRERNLLSYGTTELPDVALAIWQRLARTDVATNWILWNAFTGGFDHANPDCRPPYLRTDRHARALSSPTQTAFHLGNFIDVLKRAEPGTWSHYNFSDALDWLPEATQRSVLLEVVRTARPGAMLINRTVDRECLVAQLGLEEHFDRLEDASAEATASECSGLYQRTDLYRVRA